MRTSVLSLSVAVLALVAGCSDTGGPAAGGAEPYKITYVQGMAGNPFFTSLTCGAQERAKELGVQFDAQGGKDYSPQSQTPILNGVIAQKPDAIVISPMAGEAMVPALSKAKAAGIKLVFADSVADDATLAVSQIASDNYAGGVLAAQTLAKQVGEKGKVMVMGAKPGISTTDARQKGFEDEIGKHSGITYLGPQYSESQPATATSKFAAVFAANSDLAGVFAVSTQEVEGVATGVQNASKSGAVHIVGFDTSDPILDDVRNGVVESLIVQQPLQMGVDAVTQAVAALKGEATTPKISTPFVVLTKDNMTQPDVAKFIYKTTCD
ncbi:ABC transporter substrate-binding protein [Nonomuraea spiralis]|uniref:ABC transporter substrate-binding protein n=1 Tax=Nonomuraea TaxID=83681 RepID=UPI000F77F96A|nr:ABC transporter substrate-binding protein [Nonomuraea sp. WAC 01424]RSM95820.1 sugar ABC transporter substrate-binding protein [Nonomuraea sp. WAC 01424]